MSSKRIFIFILLLLILTFFVIYETWPIVQSESKIRKEVLNLVPIFPNEIVDSNNEQKKEN